MIYYVLGACLYLLAGSLQEKDVRLQALLYIIAAVLIWTPFLS